MLAAKYLHELSYAEIGEQLGITVNTVRVRCHRARQALRDLMEESETAGTHAEEATQ